MAFSLKFHATTTIALSSRLETDITRSLSNISTERIRRKSRQEKKNARKQYYTYPGVEKITSGGLSPSQLAVP
jgi:hypothetical protein